MTPLRGYFKTSAGIFAAGHFRGLGESFCNHHLEGGLGCETVGAMGFKSFGDFGGPFLLLEAYNR